jgi:hypothetical protein
VCIAKITARIEAKTEAEPFAAQAHGMIFLLFFSKNFIPRGRGIPIRKPIGARPITLARYLILMSVNGKLEKKTGSKRR